MDARPGTKMEKRVERVRKGESPIVDLRREHWSELLPGIWVKFLTSDMHRAQVAVRVDLFDDKPQDCVESKAMLAESRNDCVA